MLLPHKLNAAIRFSCVTDDGGGQVSPNSGQGGIRNPEENHGEGGEFNHRVDDSHEGSLEVVQFVLVGGAIVIAAFLAYQAGKRVRKKKE